MEHQELLVAIGAMMDDKIAPVMERLGGIDRRLETVESRLESVELCLSDLETSVEEVRSGNNTLLGWADAVGSLVQVPFGKPPK